MLDINKQAMRYSQHGQRITVYEKDDDGNIKYYEDADGNRIPLISDEKIGYSDPKEFYANISNKLSEVLVKEFGIDDSSTYVQIVTDKGYLPLKAGDLVWKKSEVEFDAGNLPEPTSADYTVKGVADEGLTVDLYLLQKTVK
jgi:hypothetical protein